MAKKDVVSAESYFRPPANQKTFKEDQAVVDFTQELFGVFDGVSAGYSPDTPPVMYPGNLSGGQVPYYEALRLLANLPGKTRLEDFLLGVNYRVMQVHKMMDFDPASVGVSGAGFAFCQPTDEGLKIIIAGDCFAVTFGNNSLPEFITGMDKAAFEHEDEANKKFAKCLEEAGDNVGEAWNLYRPFYQQRRFYCSNRNIGWGGFPLLNGDPALENCWIKKTVPWEQDPLLVFLGTDGLLPPSAVNPDNFGPLAENIINRFSARGVKSVLDWRDEEESKAQILKHTPGWPEATAVVLRFYPY